jgi:hypothetical protein
VRRYGYARSRNANSSRAAKIDDLRKAIQIGLDSGPADDFDIDDIR